MLKPSLICIRSGYFAFLLIIIQTTDCAVDNYVINLIFHYGNISDWNMILF